MVSNRPEDEPETNVELLFYFYQSCQFPGRGQSEITEQDVLTACQMNIAVVAYLHGVIDFELSHNSCQLYRYPSGRFITTGSHGEAADGQEIYFQRTLAGFQCLSQIGRDLPLVAIEGVDVYRQATFGSEYTGIVLIDEYRIASQVLDHVTLETTDVGLSFYAEVAVVFNHPFINGCCGWRQQERSKKGSQEEFHVCSFE
jgi:hypothetical protein